MALIFESKSVIDLSTRLGSAATAVAEPLNGFADDPTLRDTRETSHVNLLREPGKTNMIAATTVPLAPRKVNRRSGMTIAMARLSRLNAEATNGPTVGRGHSSLISIG